MRILKDIWDAYREHTGWFNVAIDAFILVGLFSNVLQAVREPTGDNILDAAIFTCFTIAVILGGWGLRAYARTSRYRDLGTMIAYTAQLHKQVVVAQGGNGCYYIDAEPGEAHDLRGIYTDEITIRYGLTPSGELVTAYRITGDQEAVTIAGILETTKHNYLTNYTGDHDGE